MYCTGKSNIKKVSLCFLFSSPPLIQFFPLQATFIRHIFPPFSACFCAEFDQIRIGIESIERISFPVFRSTWPTESRRSSICTDQSFPISRSPTICLFIRIVLREWRNSHRPCLVDGATDRTYFFAEVELISCKVVVDLAKLGLQQGQVVMLLLPNCIEFAFVLMGASVWGAIVNTANPFYKPGENAKQAKAARARIIVTQAAYVEKLADLQGHDVLVITIDDALKEGCQQISVLTEANKTQCPAMKIHPDDVMALPYSSGTTGLPKGMMLTHKGLVSSIAQRVDGENPNLYFHYEDVIPCVLPLLHIYYLNSVLHSVLFVGI